ncbi:hypothetical protein [Bacillus sp. EB01]|uniref:hypothetical protein n=1 Tax=Bacillus sp. EB01 TaxID=1347086 RepID=UPI0005C47BA3|nr:hypothetical protein [Bacillus sp. EB01]
MNYRIFIFMMACLFFIFPTSGSASLNPVKDTSLETLSKQETELEKMYTKRRALSEALLEVDQEIFRFQQEILKKAK